MCVSLTSTELVVGSVAVEVVALAVLAVVDLCRILSLLAFAGAADTVAVVAADIRTIVFSAFGVQVFGLPLVSAALADAANASLIAPETEKQCLPYFKGRLSKITLVKGDIFQD